MKSPHEALADKIAAVRLDQKHSTWPTVTLPQVSETERERIVTALRNAPQLEVRIEELKKALRVAQECIARETTKTIKLEQALRDRKSGSRKFSDGTSIRDEP